MENLINLEEAINNIMNKKRYFINIKDTSIIEYRLPYHLNESGYDNIEDIPKINIKTCYDVFQQHYNETEQVSCLVYKMGGFETENDALEWAVNNYKTEFYILPAYSIKLS